MRVKREEERIKRLEDEEVSNLCFYNVGVNVTICRLNVAELMRKRLITRRAFVTQ